LHAVTKIDEFEDIRSAVEEWRIRCKLFIVAKISENYGRFHTVQFLKPSLNKQIFVKELNGSNVINLIQCKVALFLISQTTKNFTRS
jgi:hypothetical protein